MGFLCPSKIQQKHQIQVGNTNHYNNTQHLQRDIMILEQQVKTKRRANQEMAAKIEDSMKIERSNIQELKRVQKSLDQLQARNNIIEKEKRTLQQQLRKYKYQLARLQAILNNQKVAQTQQRAAEQAAAKKRAAEQVAAKKQLMQIEQTIRTKERELRQLEGRLESIAQQKKKLDAQRQSKRYKLNEIKVRNDQLYKELEDQQRQIEMLEKIRLQLNEQIKKIQSELNIEQKQLRKLQIQVQTLADQKTRAIHGLQQAKRRYEQSQAPVEQSSTISPLFTGQVLLNFEDEKYFLISILENKLKRKIQSTKLIYRYDELNRVNFHRYIDNNTQLVILIKLVNGYLLGAWVEGSFFPRMVSDKDGLIFSLTNRRAFELKQKNRRAVAYDDYFLIVGNSEVRLKSQDKNLFSNFGLSNSYYDNRGQKVNFLLGQGSVREVEIQTYEIFQLGI